MKNVMHVTSFGLCWRDSERGLEATLAERTFLFSPLICCRTLNMTTSKLCWAFAASRQRCCFHQVNVVRCILDGVWGEISSEERRHIHEQALIWFTSHDHFFTKNAVPRLPCSLLAINVECYRWCIARQAARPETRLVVVWAVGVLVL